MVKIHPDDLLEFSNGVIPLRELLNNYQCSLADLAASIGVQMPKRVIAARAAHRWWTRDDTEVIDEARRQYDAGLIEMCQARHYDHFFLFSVPRRKPLKERRKYFSSMEGTWN